MSTASSHAGQSQWGLIWKEFSKRRLAVLSGAVIFLLMQTAIWAPFLANDRPIYYVGANLAQYEQSAQTCQGAIVQLTEQRRKNVAATSSDAAKALKLNLGLMKASLSPDDAKKLDDWYQQLQAALAEPDNQAAIKKMTELRRMLRDSLSARKLTLVRQTRWPVLASLTWADVLFQLWSLTTILFPLWRLAVKLLPTHPLRVTAGWLIWLGIPVVGALSWWQLVPVRVEQTAFKRGRLAASEPKDDKATIMYAAAVWPPIRYGLAEERLEMIYQPPPWFPTNAGNTPKDAAPSTPWDGPHWLGTDSTGRDVLSRIIWGARVSLSVGVVAVSIYVGLGILIGSAAGFFRGFVDLVISRIIEVVICFPTFFLILTIVALRGPSITNIMVVIGLTGWTGVARLVRAEFLRLVDQEFVLAGRALGYSAPRLIFRHVLPNAMAPVLVSATFGVAGAILTESALSYLGLGISIPVPSWGSLLLDGRNSDGVAPWLTVLPGLAIFVTITCYNLVGEALRDASDPRLRGSR